MNPNDISKALLDNVNSGMIDEKRFKHGIRQVEPYEGLTPLTPSEAKEQGLKERVDNISSGGLTCYEIADKLGVSHQRVQQILVKALGKMKKQMQLNGIKGVSDIL